MVCPWVMLALGTPAEGWVPEQGATRGWWATSSPPLTTRCAGRTCSGEIKRHFLRGTESHHKPHERGRRERWAGQGLTHQQLALQPQQDAGRTALRSETQTPDNVTTPPVRRDPVLPGEI